MNNITKRYVNNKINELVRYNRTVVVGRDVLALILPILEKNGISHKAIAGNSSYEHNVKSFIITRI